SGEPKPVELSSQEEPVIQKEPQEEPVVNLNTIRYTNKYDHNAYDLLFQEPQNDWPAVGNNPTFWTNYLLFISTSNGYVSEILEDGTIMWYYIGLYGNRTWLEVNTITRDTLGLPNFTYVDTRCPTIWIGFGENFDIFIYWLEYLLDLEDTNLIIDISWSTGIGNE
ncbi:MAG: hypothetical protein LBM99_02675, partial [Bacillales bacterium]|nr:hypothetical protein [Bacillales bacterium]